MWKLRLFIKQFPSEFHCLFSHENTCPLVSKQILPMHSLGVSLITLFKRLGLSFKASFSYVHPPLDKLTLSCLCHHTVLATPADVHVSSHHSGKPISPYGPAPPPKQLCEFCKHGIFKTKLTAISPPYNSRNNFSIKQMMKPSLLSIYSWVAFHLLSHRELFPMSFISSSFFTVVTRHWSHFVLFLSCSFYCYFVQLLNSTLNLVEMPGEFV